MCFNKAIELRPDLPAAWAGVAHTRKLTLADTQWFDTANAVASKNQSPSALATLYFAMGKAYDDIAKFDQAFDCYQHANRIAKTFGASYDADRQDAAIDDICRSFSPIAFQRPRASSSPSQRPVFIVGMPRSGTSLIEQIIASHPLVFGAGELRFWNNAAAKCDLRRLEASLDDDTIQSLASDCLNNLGRFSSSALRVVDKMPGNFNYLGLIHRVFPNARILHTRRHPIDTCLSIYFQNFDVELTYAKDLNDLAHYYFAYDRIMAHWKRVLPPDVLLDVPYESVVEDQEPWSRKLIEFIGLEWDDCCLDFHKTERKIGTASNWQARQPIYKTSKERWRNYEKHIGPLLPLLELL